MSDDKKFSIRSLFGASKRQASVSSASSGSSMRGESSDGSLDSEGGEERIRSGRRLTPEQQENRPIKSDSIILIGDDDDEDVASLEQSSDSSEDVSEEGSNDSSADDSDEDEDSEESTDSDDEEQARESAPSRHSKVGRGDERGGGGRCKLVAVTAILLLIGVVVTVSVVLAGPSSDHGSSTSASNSAQTPAPTPSPTPPASPSPTSVPDSLLQLLITISPDGGNALANVKSPQYFAYKWLLSYQPADSERAIQRFALATLYYATFGAQWQVSTGWLSNDDECNWYAAERTGQICDADGKIIQMDLSSNKLFGSIPAEIMLLSRLQTLDFYNNTLVGTIPPELGLLTNINNTIDLDTNKLTGTIPSQLGALSNLNALWLTNNNLSGTIPSELASMDSMLTMYLNENRLTGTVPNELCAMDSLQVLAADCLEVNCSCCAC